MAHTAHTWGVPENCSEAGAVQAGHLGQVEDGEVAVAGQGGADARPHLHLLQGEVPTQIIKVFPREAKWLPEVSAGL